MIKSLVVKGLWGRYDYDLQFNEDINIFTGSNGTGKTTLLKTLWYLYSGHFNQLVKEIYFKEAIITAKNDRKLVIRRNEIVVQNEDVVPSKTLITMALIDNKGKTYLSFESTIKGKEPEENPDNAIEGAVDGSIFFPTFRRLEGGFSLQESSDLINALRDFTSQMTKDQHRFISSSDSQDIRGLINEISSDIRIKMESANADFMNFLTKNVKGSVSPHFTEELKKKIEQKEKAETEAKEPITNLSKYIDQYFWEKSIKITDDLKLGRNTNEISVENLSAGEKNFLSFLVYASSLKKGIIFIDEPELNLHIDWQRLLLSTLHHISPKVQFFVATHSPAIYASYPDKSFWFDEIVRQSSDGLPTEVVQESVLG
ncbi:AAA family ATPase [Haliscomenobacter hydrossis]|uniref:Endonuclease GajA/Old nuclease/RecF-like AAA domain-containing protein n=1 Tax=Haliscomenobacter hydrossis (strain ATCC 27775 / DSM 1100 / LMG 10767 / O) TaxID=760192 RepID=F4KQH5_HALH1|nr:ATP-binding protein [Haliscomenobacter hydrossis]AEE49964.1 hypothetical protein Halhy_2079 [Haliscomenobacter hydrossis DSM 1100]